MVKSLSLRTSSFDLKILFNVNGKATVVRHPLLTWQKKSGATHSPTN
jgi:hypothetical protein